MSSLSDEAKAEALRLKKEDPQLTYNDIAKKCGVPDKAQAIKNYLKRALEKAKGVDSKPQAADRAAAIPDETRKEVHNFQIGDAVICASFQGKVIRVDTESEEPYLVEFRKDERRWFPGFVLKRAEKASGLDMRQAQDERGKDADAAAAESLHVALPAYDPSKPALAYGAVRAEMHGMIATRDILKGELLLLEEAFKVIDSEIVSLGPEEFEQIMALHDHLMYDGEKSLKGVIATNAFANEEGAHCMYLQAARLNHSCCPNAAYVQVQGVNVLRICALQDIAKGEEVCHSYMPCDRFAYFQSRAERLKYLLAVHHFQCECPACTVPLGQEQEDDGFRQLVWQIYQKMVEKGSGKDRAKFDPPGGLMLVRLLLEKLATYPRLDSYALRSLVCYAAFQYCMQMNQIKEAKLWICKVVGLERIFLGEDDERFKRKLRYQKDPMMWKTEPF